MPFISAERCIALTWLLAWAVGGCASGAPTAEPSGREGDAASDGSGDRPADPGTTGDASDADEGAEATARDATCGGGGGGSAWAAWPMPDPTTSGAANSQRYDATSPDFVIDPVTHLAWQRDLDARSFGWDEAKTYCACLSLGGYRDWRLPTRIELVSIVDFTKHDPALDAAAFPATPGDYFWTSSLLAGSASSAWYIFFLDGNAHSTGIDSSYRVRCARLSAPSPPDVRYAISSDGTVLDTVTGLTWQRDFGSTSFSWNEAKDHCTALPVGGGGWRLPSMKELQTLINEAATNPAIDASAFPDTPGEAFWTASPLVGGPDEAWFVDFYSGVSYTTVLAHPYRARCIR